MSSIAQCPTGEASVSSASEDTDDLVEIVDQLMRSRKITRQQYRDLSQMVLADGDIDDLERQQINRLFDAIQTGRLKVLD